MKNTSTNKRRLFRAAFSIALTLASWSASAQQYGTVPGKYNPGHYINLTWFDDYNQMEKAARPGVVGFQRRYNWKDLEPTKGNYDFSKLQKDLDNSRKLGMQFVVLVVDKSFDNRNPMPAYASGADYVERNKKGGFTALRWKPIVLDRFKLLLQKIGQRFDSHPSFEGLAIPESALSLHDWQLNKHGYTAWKYRTALKTTMMTAANAMPHSRVFWYMNYMPNGGTHLKQLALEVAHKGVVLNGPDLLPDGWKLQSMVYPLYRQLKTEMPLAISVQFDSYSHDHKDASKTTKYWTMPELFNYAKTSLYVNYVFWNNMKWKQPADSYNVYNAFPVIANNPSFNNRWVAGWLDSDKDGLADTVEMQLGTKVWVPDTDGDGLTDGEEVHEFGTKPLQADSDGGGKKDKQEITEGRNPLLTSDDYGALPDSDNDGLSDFLEESLGTNPYAKDTDGEGLTDGQEVNVYGTNPLDRNTDKDLINDRIEIVYKGTDPLNPDTDGGGTIDGLEIKQGTDPLKAWDDK